MDFNQLKYIVEIAETGSISRAANNLFISQPNLSKQVSALEEELGKTIFYRNNRGVALTSYGVEIYHHAKSIVKQFHIVENKLSSKSNENKVKIASFGSEIINFRFYEVCEKYNNENYEFELSKGGAEESIQKVLDRYCDIGLILYSELQRKNIMQYLVGENLELQDLFVGDLKIHISKKNEKSQLKVLSREDLQRLFHVKKSYLFEGIFGLHPELEYLDIPETNKTILTNGTQAYNDALHHLPSFAVEVDWKCKKKIHSALARIPYEDKKLEITCGVVKRKNERLKEELKFFINRLIESYN